MKRALVPVVVLLAAFSLGWLAAVITQPRFHASAASPEDRPLVYPKARKADQVDRYHGIDVPDPIAGSKSRIPKKPVPGFRPRIR